MSSVQVAWTGLTQLQARLKTAAARAMAPLASALYQEGRAIMAESVQICPHDTGYLRSTAFVAPPVVTGLAVEVVLSYGACVFSGGGHGRSRAYVQTREGPCEISAIRPGQFVLTQTGEYREVLAVSRISATQKPHLIDIEAKWRSGRSHTVTLTTDHRVLVHRGGRNLWVPAGELELTDELFDRAKPAHNKGTFRTAVCIWCGETFRATNRSKNYTHIYCSMDCRNKAYAGPLHPSLGKKRSPESMAPAAKAHHTLRPSGPERSVEEWLTKRGVAFERERRFGRCFADFYLPESHTVLEADGSYFHQDQEWDVARDMRLLQADPDLSIIHVHFFHPRYSPPLEANPLPGVHYVSCNPGPSSFADPITFKPTSILGLRRWTYEVPISKRGLRPEAGLYDIAVEGVHSFVVSGLIVANSYALPVHEILENHHQAPTMAKFLEVPMVARAPFLAENVSKRMAAEYAI